MGSAMPCWVTDHLITADNDLRANTDLEIHF